MEYYRKQALIEISIVLVLGIFIGWASFGLYHTYFIDDRETHIVSTDLSQYWFRSYSLCISDRNNMLYELRECRDNVRAFDDKLDEVMEELRACQE